MPSNEQTADFRRLHLEAYSVQDACNLSGVVHSFSRAVNSLWDIDRAHDNLGTNWVNSNSVTRLYVDKLRHLAGEVLSEDYAGIPLESKENEGEEKGENCYVTN